MKRLGHLRIALRQAFSTPAGYIVALTGTGFVMLLAMIMPNLRLLGFIFAERLFSDGLKIMTVAQVIWNGRIVFSHPGGWLTLALAAAFGLNVALLTHYMRRQVRFNHAAGVSTAGIFIGLLGVGCASCGSVLLSSLLGAGSAIAAVGALPLRGQEFAWVGLALSAASTFSVAKKIAEPDACAIPERK